MKLFFLLISLSISSIIISQNVFIPDANFKAYLVGNSAINSNSDTEIQVSEAAAFNGVLDCSNMNISSLTGIEEFASIISLNCKSNQITSLDISNNIGLGYFYCDSNQISFLDLSQQVNLVSFSGEANLLTSLNAANGANSSMQVFSCQHNPNLACIKIDAGYNPHSFWIKDGSAAWNSNCNTPCYVHIPDANFKAYLVGNSAINTNGNTEIECSEASAFTGQIYCIGQSITDLTGIEAFTSIYRLVCNSNSITNIDISNNTALTELSCTSNSISSLDVTSNTLLTNLQCGHNNLTTLNVSQNTALTALTCENNQLSSIDITNQTSLSDLRLNGNASITSVDLSQNTALTFLDLEYTALSSLDLSNNTALQQLKVGYCNLTALNLNANPNIQVFECQSNQIAELDLSNQTGLVIAICSSNQLTYLNVQNGNNSNMTGNNFGSNGNSSLSCIQVDDVAYSTTNWTSINGGTSFSTNCPPPCVVNIPDANFKSILLGWTNDLNTNADNEIQCSEAIAYTSNLNVTNSNISDLTGIEAFINITQLNVSDNNLTSIDLSNNTLLEWIFVNENQIDSINLSHNDSLYYLDCSDNSALTYLNVASGFNVSTLWSFHANTVPNLSCVEVDDEAWSTTNWTDIDSTIRFSVDCQGSVGVNVKQIEDLTIYPNPTNGMVNFSTTKKIKTIEIYNLTGQKVLTFNDQKTININNLPNGIYTAKIITGSIPHMIERLIKH